MRLFDWVREIMLEVGNTVALPLYRMVESIEVQLKGQIALGIVAFLDTVEPHAISYSTGLLQDVRRSKRLNTVQRQQIDDILGSKYEIHGILAFIASAANIFGVVNAWSTGWLQKCQQDSLEGTRPTLLTPQELVIAGWRQALKPEEIAEMSGYLGYEERVFKALQVVQEYRPGPTDLIRFAVRDAFREDIVKAYGYDTDFDRIADVLNPWIKSVGMSAETLRYYWRSHWELPSIQMAYEMLHRRKIGEEDIRRLLRTADMAPAFIEPLIACSYSPYTRVDVRRMYAAGVLSRDDVKNSYRDIGYDETHAENLTRWTEASVKGKEVTLSRSLIEKAYSTGQMTRDLALADLKKLGFAPADAELVIGLLDKKLADAWTDEQIKTLKAEAVKGFITLDEYGSALDGLGVSAKRKAWLIDQTRLTIRKGSKGPEKADIAAFYKAGLLKAGQAREMLAGLGYSPETSSMFISLWDKSP